MTRTRTFVTVAVGLGMAALLSGCNTANTVGFTNVSDAYLNVRFYVTDPGTSTTATAQANAQTPEQTTVQTQVAAATTNPAEAGAKRFVSDGKIQVKPGDTVTYQLTSSGAYTKGSEQTVHIQIEPVSPSWKGAGRCYWLEMMTPPPMTIVATGSVDDMKFNSAKGAVAVIPDDQVSKFTYTTVATVPDKSN